MSLQKQAKVLTKQQQNTMLRYLETTRHPKRNIVIFLLSVRAGLRAKEIASITWDMVTDAEGVIGDCIMLNNTASKGKSGGVIWMNVELKNALAEYYKLQRNILPSNHIIITERSNVVTSQVIVNMFQDWFKKLGFNGCSSHSGRRTFITNAARKISSVGGSMRDVQMLARHTSLAMTQKYIEADVDAQKKVVQMI
ncbi:MAG: site-specific integrase [Alphaproteobacteria bacterium]|nr:site-specific integrase [Alphaproteobacteria bacterium]